MNLVTLTDIPFDIDTDALLNLLHLNADSEDAVEVRRMAHEAESIGRPKAAYQISFVEGKEERLVVIDGITFTSRILRVNLDRVHRVFPYMATCGIELQHWSDGFDDLLVVYWADTIKAMALAAATGALSQHLQMQYLPGLTSTMNPGSLADWPLSEQKPFFRLLGGAAAAIGVTLSSSCLMTPNKSVTGIQFETETQYANCQLCPRLDCPNRRAPYDEALFERYSLQPTRN